jgi:hypothetical protein
VAARSLRLARSFVARSSDARLERLLGARPAQRALLRAMERRYVPGSLDGFTGDVGFRLTHRGTTTPWTLHVARGRAEARPEAIEHAAVVVRIGIADLARIAVGQLDPMKALLAGRLDVEGDFGIASRLGELFGRRPRVR